MDQYETLFLSLIIFFFSACLLFWMTRQSPSPETFDTFLKKREHILDLSAGTKKDKKKKAKKGKVIGGEKKKPEKRDAQESSSAASDLSVDNTESQQPKPSEVTSYGAILTLQHSRRHLDSGTVHQRKSNSESELSHANNDADVVQVRSVERVSKKSAEPKAVGKFVNRSSGSDKRGRMEELDEIYPVEVGNWSCTTDAGTFCQPTEPSFVTDGRKKSWHESTFRGENAKEERLGYIKSCQELNSNFEILLKQNLDQKGEIEMLRSTVHAYSVQRLNEMQVLREHHDEETKKLVDENRVLREDNRIKQEATTVKNKQLEAMNLTIDDLKQKIDIMGSALETNARMYNSSENGRKNAESRLKQFEARIKEMESVARQEVIAIQRSNDLAQRLQAKTDAFQQAMAEAEMLRKEIALNADTFQAALAEVDALRKENASLNGSRHQCEELKKNIALLKNDRLALQNWNDANELQMESSLVDCRRTFERQRLEMEETLQRKESEIGRLTEDKKGLLFRLSSLETASSELEATLVQKEQLEEKLKESEAKVEQLKQTEQQLTETIKNWQTDKECSVTGSSGLPGNQREVTVFTHVNEKAQWDMSQVVLDLDTKEAEINILQSLLTQRETKLKESEKENKVLSGTIKRLQSEVKPDECAAGDDRFRNTNGLTDTLKTVDQNELHQGLLLQLHLAQNEVKKLEKELKVLRGSTENLTDIDFAYRCVEKSLTNIVDEMEEKVKDLQDRLDVAEADKLETFLQLSQLRATHELVLEELHDLRQTMTADSYKDGHMTEDGNGSPSQQTRH